MRVRKKTNKCHIIGSGHTGCIQVLLETWWANGLFTNVVFHCKDDTGPDKKQRANASILAAASPLLGSLLQQFSDWEEDAVIVLPDYTKTALSTVLKYIYTGNISVDAGQVDSEEVQSLLKEFGIDGGADHSEEASETRSARDVQTRRSKTRSVRLLDVEEDDEASLDPDFEPLVELTEPKKRRTKVAAKQKAKIMKKGKKVAQRKLPKVSEEDAEQETVEADEQAEPQEVENLDSLLEFEMKRHKQLTKTATRLENKIKQMKKRLVKCQGEGSETDASARDASDVKVRCDECGKMIKETWMKNHKKIHEAHQYCCDKCGRTFVTLAQMKSHYRLQHMDVIAEYGGFPCTECDKVFKLRKSLKHHMTLHTGEKPHACKYCECRFRSRLVRNNHQRTHTGERPFKCSLCEKAFAQKASLVGHMKTHIKYSTADVKGSGRDERSLKLH